MSEHPVHTSENEHDLDELDRKRGFETEKEMERKFSEIFKKSKNPPVDISKWFSHKQHHSFTYEHHELLPELFIHDCNTAADLLTKRYLQQTPLATNAASLDYAGAEEGYPPTEQNSFMYDSDSGLNLLFSVKPFERPDRIYIPVLVKAPLLVTVVADYVSDWMFPSMDEKAMEEEINNDLGGIYELKASFDKEPVYGCTVVRKENLRVNNIPKNNVLGMPEHRLTNGNTIQVRYGGFYLAIKEEMLTRKTRDHVLEWEVKSKNYEIEAKVFIMSLV